MRRRWYYIWGTLLAGCVIAAVVFWPSGEPSYQGRSLSQWVLDLEIATREHSRVPSGAPEHKYHDITNAIFQIGSKGIPYYLRWLDYKQSSMSTRALEFLNDKAPDNKLTRTLIEKLDQPSRFSLLQDGSLEAFRILGASAEPAIPGLIQLLKSTNDNSLEYGSEALAFIGPKGLPPLMDALADPSNLNRRSICLDIGMIMRTNAKPAIPLLIRCLKDNDPKLHGTAALSLEYISPEPEIIIPELITVISDPKLRTPRAVAYLAKFGPQASNAIPILLKLSQENSRDKINVTASNTLRSIDPARFRKN
jgi:hypothetical protein